MSKYLTRAGACCVVASLIGCGPELPQDQISIGTNTRPAGTVVFDGRELEAEEVDGYVIVEGDIIVGRADEIWPGGRRERSGQAVVIQNAGARWPNGVVPFDFGPQLNTTQRAALRFEIRSAMDDWEAAVPALEFVDRTTESDFILFQLGTNCSSSVGRQTGMQVINLTADCIWTATSVQHEIAHALGFHHEHTRKDRDDWVTVRWGSIRGCPSSAAGPEQCGCSLGACGCPGWLPCNSSTNFVTNNTRSDVLSYDYRSVMHYRRDDFSSGAGDTLIPLQPQPPGTTIGETFQLSALDKAKMRVAYPTVTIPEFVFGDTGPTDLCTLAGREADVATDFILTGWPNSPTGNSVSTDQVPAGAYSVTCIAQSVFFAENYDYPNSTFNPSLSSYPGSSIETYAKHKVVRTVSIGAMAAIL